MFGNIKSLKSHSKSAIVAAGLLALAALPSTVEAATGPFAALSGSWSGGGTITMSSGAKERIRCRARYNVGGAGSNLDLTLRCASDSYNFELQSNASYSNGAVSGTWSETTRGVGGSIAGSGIVVRFAESLTTSGCSHSQPSTRGPSVLIPCGGGSSPL